MQKLLLDAVELLLGPLAYGLALAKGSFELGALLVPPDKQQRYGSSDSTTTEDGYTPPAAAASGRLHTACGHCRMHLPAAEQ